MLIAPPRRSSSIPDTQTQVGSSAAGRFNLLKDVKSHNLKSAPAQGKLRVLFLADDCHAANVVQDHVNGIVEKSRCNILTVNPIHDPILAMPLWMPDVILIHYSIFILSEYFLPPDWRELLRVSPTPIVQIIQDEYRHIEKMKSEMASIGVCAVLSSLSVENLAKVYSGDALKDTRFYGCLPGYISKSSIGLDVPPIADRPLDVIYRGRDLPFKLGRFAQEKELIGRHMKSIAARHNLRTDIEWEEGKRIYGDAWTRFLVSGRATLGVQGGASIFDFHDNLDGAIEAFLAVNPGAGFDAVWNAVLAPYEGNVVHKTITPRIFEAISLRTALVLYPGMYNGILEPGRHYIPFHPDGSNSNEVVARICDAEFLQQMVDNTYDDIMFQPELRKEFYVHQLDEILLEAVLRKRETQRALRRLRQKTGYTAKVIRRRLQQIRKRVVSLPL